MTSLPDKHPTPDRLAANAADQHAKQGIVDSIEGMPLQDKQLIQDLLDECKIADAVYEANLEKMCKLSCIEKEDVVKYLSKADHFQPGFCIAVRPEQKQVVLAVRGTKSLSDALTDMAGSTEHFQGGQAHMGMLRAARWLLQHEGTTVSKVMQDTGYQDLKIIGHSLGAGTAALLAMMLHNDTGAATRWGNPQMSCVGFATPPVVCEENALRCRDYITTVVCQHDVIPRSCLATFEDLRKEIAASNWEDQLKDKVLSHKLSQMAASAASTLGGSIAKDLEHHVQQALQRQSASDSGQGGGEDSASSPSDQAKAPQVEAFKWLRDLVGYVSRADKLTEAQDAAEATTDSAVEEAAKFIEPTRLYAPGRLLFITRETGKSKTPSHSIIDGDPDPKHRFKRIVLTSSLISDHLCTTYRDALEDILARM
eukprot:jgi/Astpho2/9711/Aster-x0409